MEQGKDADAAVPRDERGRHPLCASYARRIAGHLCGRITAGELRVGDALTWISYGTRDRSGRAGAVQS